MDRCAVRHCIPHPHLSWLLLALLAGSPAPAAAADPADFFPLLPGASWTYTTGTGDKTREVQPPSPAGSPERVLRTVAGPDLGEEETFEVTTEGILQHRLISAAPDSTLIVFTPSLIRLPRSVSAGSSGSQSGEVAIGGTGAPGTYSYEWEVLSLGPATTPAGSVCEALLFRSLLSISALGDTTTENAQIQLVRGLGMVSYAGDVDGEPFSDQYESSSLPFPLDTDCDGILDDGNLSGTVGDLFCRAPLVQLCDDNCRVFANPDQADPDGNKIGSACECGDQNGDGRVNVSDLVAINLAIYNPPLQTPLCDADGDPDHLCNVNDIIAANRKIYGGTAYCSRYPRP